MPTPVYMTLLALLISPIGLALIVILIENRPFVIADQYLAFLIGDVLLAFAIGAGFAGAGRPLWSWWLLIAIAAGVIFGWWQLGAEVSSGAYTTGEALSPSKLYHQFICYPALAALLTRAVYFAWGKPLLLSVMAVFVVGWMSLNVWDWSHPKDPHQQFDWSAPNLSDSAL